MEIKEREALLAALLDGRLPDANGRFGPFGGRFVPETLMPAIERLTHGVQNILPSAEFQKALSSELKSWVGRPTALTHAPTLSKNWGADVWLKREDLAHTGAHKINNGIGQALLAKALGAKRIVAETGAGQHGVASAAACARVGLPCTVYMGEIDVARQAPNVDRMRRFGARVVPVKSGDRTLRAAIDEAIRDWVSDPVGTYYLLGSAIGPHPYPLLVRELQAVIGREARAQMIEVGGLPDAVFACVGGGSNAIGMFHGFLADRGVKIFGVEAGGRGNALGEHSATLSYGKPGVLHGTHTMLLYDKHGQIQETHSISAGLDYPGVGPEHALLQSIGRVEYVTASDTETLAALEELCASEGILPALESSHALAGAKRWAAQHRGARVLIGLSGRGDKDMPILAQYPMAERKHAAA
ncbi:MAG TPA: tryptophan synthase subunit beta [Gammaproteobacteria bacterium]|nr:tryptophan synthase subunit beta [Gammaproteobacteria bacterium]